MLKNLFKRKKLKTIVLDDTEFEIKHIIRKNMKKIVLRVEQKNVIKVSSNKIPKKNIIAFILEQKEWILNLHVEMKNKFSEDKIFYYLAKEYKIRHFEGKLHLNDEFVFLHVEKAKKQTDDFYKKKAKEYLPQRVEFWKNEMNLEFNRLIFRLAKTRWGSCSSNATISLNPYLMKLSPEMIDYVIVHELAHLIYMNHSKKFYKHISYYIKNYIVTQDEIKKLSQKF